MSEGRVYICTDCGERVEATWFQHGDGYPGLFTMTCSPGCTILDSAPYEMSQAETPDNWRVLRPPCCRDEDVSDLEIVYDDGVSDYRCPDCGATYRWDGTMSTAPVVTGDAPRIDENQEDLTDV